MMRLNHRLCSITPWLLKRTELPFFSPLSANQTASYYWRRRKRNNPTARISLLNFKGNNVFDKSEILGNHLLLAGQVNDNRVVSPLSLQVVLSLLAAGYGGRSRRQLLKLFGADSADTLNYFSSQISDTILADGEPRMRCSNALWIDESLSLNPSFQRTLDSYYKASLHPLDFHTQAFNGRQQINSWVESETSGLVKDLIREESLDKSVKLVFTNALYFKGSWEGKAGRSFRTLEDYWNKNFVEASFMVGKRKEFGRSCRGRANVYQQIKKPSEDKRFILHRFLYPRIPAEDGFKFHVKETQMDIGGRKTPKFDISSEMEASHVLRQLGVKLPFSGGKLTEMLRSSDGKMLHVFSIFQKAFMETNEQGTEAATATVATVMSGRRSDLPPVPPISFEAYFPYLFGVGRDRHGSIYMAKTQLMVGQILNPPSS